MKGKDMKNKKDELLPEYNFDYSNAVRGKYYKKLIKEGSNIIILEPDIADAFHDSESVNKALRSLLEIARSTASSGKLEKRAGN
ncbi:MAG: hypothetical protein JW927_13060 [Deltaproteobacteria bacterium]|nr:hypothetical protein [Deltaproteobacteria bacterium]